MRSLGYADHSIPLVLYYFFVMEFTPITELILRFPMILSGLLTLLLFPLAIRQQMNFKIVLIFAILVAMSPFMISYARIARPYAVTLFGIYVAFWCLERAIKDRQIIWWPASAYVFLSGLIIWMHAITGPILIAPLIVLWWSKLRGRDLAWVDIVLLTGSTGLIMALAVLPPLLLDLGAIKEKSGIDSINWETVYGALFLWFGTGSMLIVLLSAVLASLGWAQIWRSVPIVRWVALGSGLTATILFLSEPWFINQPLALGRYLLPLVPVLLLAVATGIVRVAENLNNVLRTQGNQSEASYVLTCVLATPFLVASWHMSPLPELLSRPNSYTQDSYFQLDYRKENNPVRPFARKLTESPFWAKLNTLPSNTLKVAVAPFSYAIFDWPAPLWEGISHQTVVPAYLWGTCKQTRHGETPDDGRFIFRNAVHVKNINTSTEKEIDYLIFFIIKKTDEEFLKLKVSVNDLECEKWVRLKYGNPDYEDPELIVWRVNPSAPLLK